MLVSDIITSVVSSSWLKFMETVLDDEYGYLLSFNPVQFNIKRDSNDIAYVTMSGDSLPKISYAHYETVNYAPLLFFLNTNILHPLYIPTNIQIWVPNSAKIYTFYRDITLVNN